MSKQIQFNTNEKFAVKSVEAAFTVLIRQLRIGATAMLKIVVVAHVDNVTKPL